MYDYEFPIDDIFKVKRTNVTYSSVTKDVEQYRYSNVTSNIKRMLQESEQEGSDAHASK